MIEEFLKFSAKFNTPFTSSTGDQSILFTKSQMQCISFFPWEDEADRILHVLKYGKCNGNVSLIPISALEVSFLTLLYMIFRASTCIDYRGVYVTTSVKECVGMMSLMFAGADYMDTSLRRYDSVTYRVCGNTVVVAKPCKDMFRGVIYDEVFVDNIVTFPKMDVTNINSVYEWRDDN